jgi:hypothetical protein
MVAAGTSRHLRSCSAASSPRSGRNSTYPAVRIWPATSLRLAKKAPVHLITNDRAFFEGREISRGLAKPLAEETLKNEAKIFLHSKIADFLSVMKSTIHQLDEGVISQTIIVAVGPAAGELANEQHFLLGDPSPPQIRGYATPKTDVVAVSFEIKFALTDISERTTEDRRKATLRISGNGAYSPASKSIEGIHIEEWSISLKNGGTSWSDPKRMRQWAEGKFRLLG